MTPENRCRSFRRSNQQMKEAVAAIVLSLVGAVIGNMLRVFERKVLKRICGQSERRAEFENENKKRRGR